MKGKQKLRQIPSNEVEPLNVQIAQDGSATHWDSVSQALGVHVRVCRRWREGQPPPALQAPLIQGVQAFRLLGPEQSAPPQEGAGLVQLCVCTPGQVVVQGLQPPLTAPQPCVLAPEQTAPPQDGAGELQEWVCVQAEQMLQTLQPPATAPQPCVLAPEQAAPPQDGAGELQEWVCRQAEQMLQTLQPPSTGRQQA